MNAITPNLERLVEIAQALADEQGRAYYVVEATNPKLSYSDRLPYCVAVDDAEAWDHLNHRCRVEPRSNGNGA